MSFKDGLISAKKLIETPDKWCKGVVGNGRRCAHLALLDAGALRAAGCLAACLPFWWRLRWRLEGRWNFRYIVRFNDHPSTTHTDVMALFDRAIANAEDRS